MMVLWFVAFVVLGLVRAWLLVGLFGRGPMGWVVAVPELLALVLGLVNVFAARVYHVSCAGLAVPFLYLVGLLCLVVPNFGSAAACLVWVAFGLSCWGMCCLGSRFTFGATSWVRLVDTGPYRWMRHPQQSARLLICCSAACSWPLWSVQWVFCLVAAVASVLVALCEEASLCHYPEWREYSRRVPWRFIPGVL